MLALKRPLSPALHITLRIVFVLLFLAAIVLRVSLYNVQTSDYTVFLSSWYDFIKNNGGFAAFKSNFSNYNVPYLYLLALTTYLPISKLIAIKTVSILFDAVLAIFTYLILDLRYKNSYIPIIGVLAVLFAPTIFINSAAWGQADATYAAFCLGSLYFLLKDRPGWACTFFALAISFKLQAIFFAPVLLVLLVRRKLPLKYLILIPLVFLLLLVPALIAGRSAVSLLSIYPEQVSSGGVGGGANPGGFTGGRTGSFPGGTGSFPSGMGKLPSGTGGRTGNFPGGAPGGSSSRGNSFASTSYTYNAPSFYQWLPANASVYWKWVGIILAGIVVLAVAALAWRSKQKITGAMLIKIALVFALALPFLLPSMHERYFYLADVLSILFAFYFPRYFFVAILVQLCSLLSYSPYFLNTQIVGLPYIAFVELVLSVIVFVDLILALYPDIRKKKELPLASVDEETPKVKNEDVSWWAAQ